MIPRNVRFDRYAQLSGGLDVVSLESPLTVQVNGVGLVTGWLEANSPWTICSDDVVTTWSACQASPSTAWTPVSAPSTTWTPI